MNGHQPALQPDVHAEMSALLLDATAAIQERHDLRIRVTLAEHRALVAETYARRLTRLVVAALVVAAVAVAAGVAGGGAGMIAHPVQCVGWAGLGTTLFTGIGGFGLAATAAGWETIGQVEIDPFCHDVLTAHWPGRPTHDDITTLSVATAEQWLGGRGLDLITAGFPCQDLSIAGRRAGLAGQRSGLYWQIIRLAADLAPAWIVLENVPTRGGQRGD